jgi:virginiamycin B lyase
MNWNSLSNHSHIRANSFVQNSDHLSPAAHICLAAMLAVLPAALKAQPQAGIIEHPLPGMLSQPASITPGPDGAVWFTEFNGHKIGRISAAGVITEFPSPGSPPEVITYGPDGALWFTEFDGLNIGRITVAGVITEFPVTPDTHAGITKGPDAALWFTENLSNKIGRINTAGGFSEFPIPTLESFPSGITVGRDGALWFAEFGVNQIGRLTTAGVFTEHLLPTANSGPSGITAGPDGALWFTESGTSKIGRITTAGVITEFPLPTAFSRPYGITPGPDGALWFTEFDGNQVGRITTAGVVTEYPVPAAFSSPAAITVGHDGSLWYGAYDGNRIDQVVIPTALLTATPNTGAPGGNVTFTGSGFAANESVKLYVNSTGTNLTYTGTTDGTGSLLLPSKIFAAPLGYNAVVGVGQSSGALGFTPFTIKARLTLAPKTVSVGSTVTGSGYGFASGERVDLYWIQPFRFLGEVTADSHGTFASGTSLVFTVPTGASPGTNVVRAVGQSSAAIVYNSVTVQ